MLYETHHFLFAGVSQVLRVRFEQARTDVSSQVPQPAVNSEQVFAIADGEKVESTVNKVASTTVVVQVAVNSAYDSTSVQLVSHGYLSTSVLSASGPLTAAQGGYATHEFSGLNPSTEYTMRTCVREKGSPSDVFSEVRNAPPFVHHLC